MTRLVISPHDDDSCLFLSFLCLREKPIIVVVTDSYIQPNRGERGCSAMERAEETAAAHAILGNEVSRLDIRDDRATENDIAEALRAQWDWRRNYVESVYAPALQGGNVHHDMCNRAAHRVFPGNVIEYATYTKTELYTKGNVEIIPTPEELELKRQALACYVSQWRINRPHFEAVLSKSEWLM